MKVLETIDPRPGVRWSALLTASLAVIGLTSTVAAQPSPGSDRPGVRESSNPLGDAPPEVMGPSARAGMAGDTETKSPTDPEDPFSVSVRVTGLPESSENEERSVTLRASRPKGPFEKQEPKPKYEWTKTFKNSASVRFSNVPGSLTETGLELYALTTFQGVTFKSQRAPPAKGTKLTIEVFETTESLEDLSFSRLRTVAKPWEDYMVVTQYYTLNLEGDRAIDGSQQLMGRDQPGIPITLPLQAKGIQVQTGAKHKTVNSTVFWQGTLRPGQSVPVRVRFSISASTPTFEFTQKLDYPAHNLEVIAPIDVRYDKVQRLDDLRLAAPGFDTVETTDQIQNLRRNTDYLYAHGASLKAGETLRFKLYGLPFREPIAPWVVFGLGVLGAVGIIGYAAREKRSMESHDSRQRAESVLEEERETLLDELAILEQQWEDGQMDEVDYETERLRLRERLALVTRKLNELREE